VIIFSVWFLFFATFAVIVYRRGILAVNGGCCFAVNCWQSLPFGRITLSTLFSISLMPRYFVHVFLRLFDVIGISTWHVRFRENTFRLCNFSSKRFRNCNCGVTYNCSHFRCLCHCERLTVNMLLAIIGYTYYSPKKVLLPELNGHAVDGRSLNSASYCVFLSLSALCLHLVGGAVQIYLDWLIEWSNNCCLC